MATKEKELVPAHPFIEVQDIKTRNEASADGRYYSSPTHSKNSDALTKEEEEADRLWAADAQALGEQPRGTKHGYVGALGLYTADEEPFTGTLVSGLNGAVSLDGVHSWGILRGTATIPYKSNGLICEFENGLRKGLPLLYESDEHYATVVKQWRRCTTAARETYAQFLPSVRPEIMELVRETPNVLALARDQVKYEPAMKIHGVSLGWLRYASQTSSRNQNDGRWSRARPAPTDGTTLLYDGPAFSVAPVLAGKSLPGSVWITAGGQFICSTWCQREVSQMPDVDLYTGRTLKHSLMTWLLGPGLEHFGDVGKNVDRAPRRIRRTPDWDEETILFLASLGAWWESLDRTRLKAVYTTTKVGSVYLQSMDQFDVFCPQDQYRGFTMRHLKVEGGPPFHVAYPDGRNGVWYHADGNRWYHIQDSKGQDIIVPAELLAEMDRLLKAGKLSSHMMG